MNPFEFQAAMARQWMAMAGQSAQAAASLYQSIGQQAMQFWRVALPTQAPASMGSWPMMQSWMPWMPSTHSPFNMFGAYPNPFASLPATFGGNANAFAAFMPPMSFSWGPSPMMPFQMATPQAWMWPFAMFAGSAGSAPGGNRIPNPAADFMDTAATAYRSASGYAVATILAPFTDAMTSAQTPWMPPSTGRKTTH